MRTEVPNWLIIAMEELGEEEVLGAFSNPRIVEYLGAVGESADDEIPWCSAFVNWCVVRCNIVPTLSAASRSWEQWGQQLDKFKFGCIAVFERGKERWMGHVGFALAEIGENILLLGGNQADSVKISLFPKSKLLSYRWNNEK